MGMGMGMPMGMPMIMGMPHLVGNPFDQGLEIEYSPITQLVSSVAHLMEMHQKSKEREEGHTDSHSSHGPMFPEFSQLQSQMRGRPGMSGSSEPHEMVSNGPKFHLIPYTQNVYDSSGHSSTSRLINSIPPDNIPSVMWRIGDLIGKNDPKEKENLYDMTKIKGFPILKVSL
uniref:Mediator complex subunit 19 n=1 Tax=Caenorhabditis tropicalis TaxID=1561998 RepID=A0A1I7T5F1_9PELO